MIPFQFTSPASTSAGTNGILVPANLESKEELLAFLGRTIPLPDYFGHNWDALDECLCTLDWLAQPKLILIHQDIPLKNRPADQRLYLRILVDASSKSDRLSIFFPESFRWQIKHCLPDEEKGQT